MVHHRHSSVVLYHTRVISTADLTAIANARLEDAIALRDDDRLDGAAYLCGYAVELTLKARICVTLKWQGFPETKKEFENYSSFKTHNLDVLLRLSGQEERIKEEYISEWSAVATWDPETRYKAVGRLADDDVDAMLVSVIRLLDVL